MTRRTLATLVLVTIGAGLLGAHSNQPVYADPSERISNISVDTIGGAVNYDICVLSSSLPTGAIVQIVGQPQATGMYGGQSCGPRTYFIRITMPRLPKGKYQFQSAIVFLVDGNFASIVHDGGLVSNMSGDTVGKDCQVDFTFDPAVAEIPTNCTGPGIVGNVAAPIAILPTSTPTPSATPTNTPTPSATPTNTPTPSATPTNTPTPSTSPTRSSVPTAPSTATGTSVATTRAQRSPTVSAGPTDAGLDRHSMVSQAFFAEGYTGPGYQEYLSLLNPGLQIAHARVTIYYMTGQRQIRSVFSLAPLSRRTLDINALVPRDSTALQVEADRPVVAERAMYHGNGHVVAGAPSLGVQWYLAEGYVGHGFIDGLRIFNPNTTSTTVGIMTYRSDGSSRLVQRAIAGRARLNVALDDIAPVGGVAVAIHSALPVVVEEVVQHVGATGPSAAMGWTRMSRTWYFPDGGTSQGNDEYIAVFNPNQTPAYVRLRAVSSDGYTRPFSLRVAPHSRGVFIMRALLKRPGLAAVVESDHPVVAQEVRYTVTGALSIVNGTPHAAPAWAFADGYAGQGFKEWLSFLNPGAQQAVITIRLIGRNGVLRVLTLRQSPHHRGYLYVNALVPRGPVAAVITTTHPIVAGRTVIDNHGAGLSTTVGVALSRP